MKLWLDDIRPAPRGWKHVKTVPEAIRFFKSHKHEITEISLDHDLGEDTPPGIKFLDWLEMHLSQVTLPQIKVHSMNPVGRAQMEKLVSRLERKSRNVHDTEF